VPVAEVVEVLVTAVQVAQAVTVGALVAARAAAVQAATALRLVPVEWAAMAWPLSSHCKTFHMIPETSRVLATASAEQQDLLTAQARAIVEYQAKSQAAGQYFTAMIRMVFPAFDAAKHTYELSTGEVTAKLPQ